MSVKTESSFDPFSFYSLFKSLNKDSNVREYVLNTSNSCHRIFISKNKNEKSKKIKMKHFPTTWVYNLLPILTMCYLNQMTEHRSVPSVCVMPFISIMFIHLAGMLICSHNRFIRTKCQIHSTHKIHRILINMLHDLYFNFLEDD